jgi:hypothetical protein
MPCSVLELNGIIQIYADDTIIKYSASSLDEILRMINENLVLLRTNFVLSERRSAIRLSNNHVLRYGDGIVQRVDTIKYLGLYLGYETWFLWSYTAYKEKNIANYVCAEKIESFNYDQ